MIAKFSFKIIENLRKKLDEKEAEIKKLTLKLKEKDEVIAKQEKDLNKYKKLYTID
jgi:hypothetical protein